MELSACEEIGIVSKDKDYNTVPSEGITISKGSVIAFKKGNTELRDKVQNALSKITKEGSQANMLTTFCFLYISYPLHTQFNCCSKLFL